MSDPSGRRTTRSRKATEPLLVLPMECANVFSKTTASGCDAFPGRIFPLATVSLIKPGMSASALNLPAFSAGLPNACRSSICSTSTGSACNLSAVSAARANCESEAIVPAPVLQSISELQIWIGRGSGICGATSRIGVRGATGAALGTALGAAGCSMGPSTEISGAFGVTASAGAGPAPPGAAAGAALVVPRQ